MYVLMVYYADELKTDCGSSSIQTEFESYAK